MKRNGSLVNENKKNGNIILKQFESVFTKDIDQSHQTILSKHLKQWVLITYQISFRKTTLNS